ncbi:unknown [Cercopithecine alphaherpesvirus 9]|uniref:Uncharacterized protein n=1 Tax=Cercopithecine herpesvirus 9 (strain DHV) TaxID=36348 RepID=Q9E1X5_CHV9D|nr:tegument protein UL16 [Cercopithecine alphaherpesvirus 9]AAG27218.1 unknown [Cercopithecine alphaherpesvirus 9]
MDMLLPSEIYMPGKSSARILTPCAAERLTNALTLDMGLWKSVLTDSRVKIIRSTAFITSKIAPFIPPPTLDSQHPGVIIATVYITRPRQLNLPQKHFHVIVNFNYEISYCLTALLRIYPIDGMDNVVGATFGEPTALALPECIPDPRADPTPVSNDAYVNLNNYLQAPRLPKNVYACKMLSPGVWWSDEKKRLYVLAMDSQLLGLCPAGWQTRILGAVLGRLLSHSNGCSECYGRKHVGSLLATPTVPNHTESCVCWAPCMWRKAGRRDLKVQGDIGNTQVLFMDAVTSIRIISSNKNPRITSNLSDIISGTNISGMSIPANVSGWQLYMFGESVSRAIINGCALLQRLCHFSYKSNETH